ncbi:MAG: response regulator [Lachnospiraceae bacterium]|nr:response regulator [Lachnospiraceae bacterium]
MDSIVYTNDNCIGCNKCIKVCSAIGACIFKQENGKSRIVVDGSKCVACGSCIDVCEHHAREFSDDTDRFFDDLKRGDNISLLLAPAFRANYPDRYERVLGGLKAMGVNRILSVSFGADITTWGYLNYIKEHDFYGGISQPCPAVVSYIEHYIPELLPKLFPVQSPLMCAAIYARQELKITDKFAFISPCIAKKIEIDDPNNKGLVQYNVTFEHLMKYVEEHKIEGQPSGSEVEYGLGSYYPTPGGLAENVRWFLGDDIFIRQVEGEKHLYEWLHRNSEKIINSETPYLLIDALNCSAGCICGTAVDSEKSKTEEALYELLRIREEAKKSTPKSPWSRSDTPQERLESYNRQFENLNLDDYIRNYSDLSGDCIYHTPGNDELDRVFNSMNKFSAESRSINCTCCGYDSCKQMAYAIYNGFNQKENCIYYEKTMVQELEVRNRIAEESTKAKSAFLANMSHEIRTPINAVLGMDELILRESREKPVREYASNIKRSGNVLLSLVNNILDFSKIEAGKMELVADKYDLVELVEDAIEMISPRAEAKGLKVDVSIGEDTPRYLFGDSVRVAQCMINILTNAVKYTERGGVSLSIGLKSRDRRMARIRVCIKDTGIGIRKADLDRLFGAFERIDLEHNRTVEGTGLGMSIVQKLLEMMGSRLEVSSKYGEGSEFSFELDQGIISDEKVGDADSPGKADEKATGYSRSFVAPNARILVVDDAEMNLKVIRGLLKQTHIRIDTALSGDEALNLIEENEYDILLLDHMMPGMDGLELFNRIKGAHENPNSTKPCIILTANAISGARDDYIEMGFDDYLSKPVDGKKLELMLMDFLPGDKYSTAESTETDIYEGIVGGMIEDPRFSDLEGIDSKAGIKNSGSCEDYSNTLKIFYDSIDEKSGELMDLYERKDWPGYTIKVHALKSMANIIGAAGLAGEALALEYAGKEGNISYIEENHDKLITYYLSFKEVLKDICQKEDKVRTDGDSPRADADLIGVVCDTIREAAANMDIDSIESALDDISGYVLPDEERGLLDKVRELSMNFDYDGILSVLKVT